MALPKIEAPKFTCVLPLSKQKVEYRPFLAQEERVLLMAAENKDVESHVRAMKDIAAACTYGVVNADILAALDLEFLFLQLRTKAVGETVTVGKECENVGCKTQLSFVVNLEEIKFEYIEEFHVNKKIDVGGGVGIMMKSPTADTAVGIRSQDLSQAEQLFMMIKSSIDFIYDDKQQYKASEYSDSELSEFIDQLPLVAMQAISKFFEEQPKMVYNGEKQCKCGANNKIHIEGIGGFFT